MTRETGIAWDDIDPAAVIRGDGQAIVDFNGKSCIFHHNAKLPGEVSTAVRWQSRHSSMGRTAKSA